MAAVRRQRKEKADAVDPWSPPPRVRCIRFRRGLRDYRSRCGGRRQRSCRSALAGGDQRADPGIPRTRRAHRLRLCRHRVQDQLPGCRGVLRGHRAVGLRADHGVALAPFRQLRAERVDGGAAAGDAGRQRPAVLRRHLSSDRQARWLAGAGRAPVPAARHGHLRPAAALVSGPVTAYQSTRPAGGGMKMGLLSKALGRIQPSATVAISRKAADMQRAGRDVISLAAGEPDFDTPRHVRDAAIQAINAGKTRYTNVDGIPELKEAVARKFRRDNGLEVGIPVPYWVGYPEIVRLCDATPVYAKADASTGFKLTPEALEAAITPRSKWLILNTPSNPSGAAYSAAELGKLAEVLMRHPQVHVLTDGIYEVLVYDGGRFATIAGVEPALQPRTLTMNGVSKSHAMTGWRIGYCTGPRELLGGM